MNRNSSFNRTPDQVFGSRVCHVRGLPSSRTRWMRWMTQDTPRLDGYAHTAPAPAPAPAGRPAGSVTPRTVHGRQTVLGGGGPRASAASVRPQHALTLKPLALPGLSRPGHNTHRSARARRHVQASTIFVPHPFVCRNADCALLSLPVHPGRRCRRLARLANESPEHAARRPVGLSSQPQVLRRPRLTSPHPPSGPVGLKLHRTAHSAALLCPNLCPRPRSQFSAEMHPGMQVLTTPPGTR